MVPVIQKLGIKYGNVPYRYNILPLELQNLRKTALSKSSGVLTKCVGPSKTYNALCTKRLESN